jgi:hypothetical protein
VKPFTDNVAAVVESDRAKPAVFTDIAPFAGVTVNAPTTAALEGTTETILRPKAATATSAMRLKFVVVDICFLSLVVTRNFLVAASR